MTKTNTSIPKPPVQAKAQPKKPEGQVSQEQIDQWKQLHGEVHYIAHDNKIAYFRKPGRLEIGHGMTYGAGNVLEMSIATMQVCYLGGCDALMEDELFLSSAGLRFNDLVELRQVEMGKL